MELDAGTTSSPAPEEAGLPGGAAQQHPGYAAEQHPGYAAAQHAVMQPDLDVQSVASSQSLQLSHQQHQHMLQSYEASANAHLAPAAGVVSQGVGSHGHAAEVMPSQTATMSHNFASSAAQVPGFGSGTNQLPGIAANAGSQGTRHGIASALRHSHGEEEEQAAVPLQHASSTSAMLSLAQQASQASWASQQQAAKRHSRHTGHSSQAFLDIAAGSCPELALQCVSERLPC